VEDAVKQLSEWLSLNIKQLIGYIRLMRIINSVMMGIAVIVAAVLTEINVIHGGYMPNLFFGFLTGFFLTAASMVINDYYDREIDAINEPTRPIPSNLVKPRNALVFAAILTILGLTAGLLTSKTARLECFLTALIFWLISVVYATFGKKTGFPGNLLVSACVSAPFIYGSLATVGAVRGRIWVFVAMVFLSNTGREITKGIVDVQGDKVQNVKTLAVLFGEQKAAKVAALFYILAVALTPIPPLLNMVSFWFIPLVTVTDLGLVTSSLKLLKDYTRENAKKVKNQVLGWFLTGLLAFIAGSVP